MTEREAKTKWCPFALDHRAELVRKFREYEHHFEQKTDDEIDAAKAEGQS